MSEPGKILYDYVYDKARETLRVVKSQDVEPILKAVHHMPSAMDKRKYLKNSKWYRGSIPAVIGLQWAQDAGVRYLSREWNELALKKLQEPEFSKLRLRW